MRVIYLSYTGLTEPLGVSQVLAYLKELAAIHTITLITFEKRDALADGALIADLQRTCDEVGIRWVPRLYHHRPRLLATAWDLVAFTRTALRERRALGAELIHARAYIATFVAAIVGSLTRTPFIFDTRSFWPEEMITAGRLKQGSLLHRGITWAERACLRRAAGIVFLTHAAADYIRVRDPWLATADIVTIPTCANLTNYVPAEVTPPSGPLRVVSIGTLLSGWFRIDQLFSFFAALRCAAPDTRFAIYSRDDADRIRAAAVAHGFDPADMVIEPLAAADVPAALRAAHVLPMFYETGLARLAGFPTRMAEALGSGVPVIANGDSGEVAGIVAENRVGVLVKDRSPAAMTQAVNALLPFLRQPDLIGRCRDTAERLFSVEGGVRDYAALYARIATQRAVH